jgi:glutathione S-transferase
MPYRLHCFCQSGNAYKAAMMLDLLGVPWEPIFVDFFGGQTRDPAWRETLNATGEVPVLEDGGLKLSQSGVILDYLAEKHGRFGGRTPEERREVWRWILFDNHKFTSYFATYRFMRSLAPQEPDPGAMAFLKGRADANLAIVDKHLADHAFMLGPDPSIADLSMSAYLFYPKEEHGYDFAATHPHIAAWLDRIAEMRGWKGPYETLPGQRIAPRR